MSWLAVRARARTCTLAAEGSFRPSRRAGTIIGGVTLAYAWLYPHFLDSQHPAMYLIASPMGLLPCPTLSLVLGFGLLAGGMRSRAWALITAGAGLFYALFGMFRLGVWLDAGLLVAACSMLGFAWHPGEQRRPDAGAKPVSSAP